MSTASYIVMALAIGISNMLLFRRCSEVTPIRLTTGLLVSFLLSAIHVIFMIIGSVIGNLLSFTSVDDPDRYNDVNSYVFLGLAIIVVLKLLSPYLKRNPKLPLFNLQSWSSVVAMSVATGINVLFIGIGFGFVAQNAVSIHLTIWPLLISSFIFSYFGIMFGRRKVAIRPRIWTIFSCILILGVAIAAVVNA